SQTGNGEYLLGQSGNSDVLTANEDPATGERSVSQNVLVVNGSNDVQSISERKRLFENAVWWLLRRPLCGLTDLVISPDASADQANTGEPLIYTLTVQRSGECEGTGAIVTDTLPPGVKFVSANTPQGTWSEADGVVTFHLGLLEEVFLQLTVTVVPQSPGPIVNNVRIRNNEREQNLNNNVASLTVQVQGAPVGLQDQLNGKVGPVLSLEIGPDGLIQLNVTGEVGVSYAIESSEDLATWALWSQFVATAPTTK